MIGLGLVTTMCAEAVSTIAARGGSIQLASWALWVNSWLLIPTAWLGIVSYLLVFPSGSLPSRRWRFAMVGLMGLTVVGVAARMVQPWDGERLVNPLGVGAMEAFSEAMFGILSVVFAIAVVAAVVSVVLRFRRGTPADRSALRWLAVVAILAAALLVTAIGAGALGLDSDRRPVRGRLPSRGDRRAAGHRGRGAPNAPTRRDRGGGQPIGRVRVDRRHVTVIYAAIVAGIGAVVGRSERSDVFAAVAATAVAAVAFQPARRRAQRFADRLIYGDRASPYELVATFTERLDDASLSEVLPRMTTLIAEGTGADRIRIWLRSGSDLRSRGVVAHRRRSRDSRSARRWRASDDGRSAFPVRHGGDLLGAITVAMPPQEPMTPATERLLTDLSAQAGLVLRNVALVEEIQRSRQRIVSSQDEARRRLERDLHDGAQQRLVTLSLNLRMARDRAEASGDPDLTTSLGAAEQELAHSLAELRELARGIHPAILTQNGVGAAVRSLADRSTVPVEVRRAPDARFAPEVEATAYFVVSEALANVSKHAEASHVWIAVEDNRGVLAIDVRDDGIGGATLDAGSGLRGLADRVEAVGGWIDVHSAAGAGSTVHAEIPCASR